MNSTEEFPVAEIRNSPAPRQWGGMIVSRLWWVTLLCLVGAVGLVIQQLRSPGLVIEVRFAAGHGLEPGDAVRYRGIDVGEVTRVELDAELAGVSVWIELTPASAALAREGARFWIQRPDIRVGQIRGLETLVGGRYVGVVPGPADAAPSRLFYGLDVALAPVDQIAEGLEIVLEANERHGLQSGSTVSYRGVVVGHILAVGLSNDAVTVEARAFIQPKYRQLIRENSRFWNSSGLGLSIGLGGIELDAETLATIASGGVAFATPGNLGRPAATGHRFELYDAPQGQWLAWQPRVALGSSALPPGVPLPSPLLGVRRPTTGAQALFGTGSQRAWMLPLVGGQLLAPASMLAGPETYVLEMTGSEFDLPWENVITSGSLALVVLPEVACAAVTNYWPRERLRVADGPEAVVVTCGSDERTMPLPAQRLSVVEEGWEVAASVPVDDAWHGACVLSAQDGAVIGVLVRSENRAVIALLTRELLESK